MVVVIDNYDSFTYNLVQRLGEIDPNVNVRVFRNDELTVEQIEQHSPSRLLVSPGPCTPTEAGISVDCVKHFAGRIPLLGVCLGHQSIGQAFGGNIIRAPELMHGKTDEIVHDNRGLLADLANPFVATRYHSLVYDFGPGRQNGYRAADWSLLPAMRRLAITAPDLMIASHADSDHSGGLYSMSRYSRSRVLLSGTAGELRRRMGDFAVIRDCHEYPAWRWDEVVFRFLPASAADYSGNNRSCVLMVTGHHRVLLPGDIEIEREQALLERMAEELRADMLVAPHHGSATSSSAGFVTAVEPAHVVFTVGRNNRWGFPPESVLARYRAVGSRIWRTDRDGAIRLQSRVDHLDVRAWLWPGQRLWRRW